MTVEQLWQVTGNVGDFETEELCNKLSRLSLLLRFDLAEAIIRLHDILHEYLIRQTAVSAVAVYDGGRRAISASEDTTLKVWDLESRNVEASFYGNSGFYACTVGPDGTIIAGEASGRVHILRLEEPLQNQ